MTKLTHVIIVIDGTQSLGLVTVGQSGWLTMEAEVSDMERADNWCVTTYNTRKPTGAEREAAKWTAIFGGSMIHLPRQTGGHPMQLSAADLGVSFPVVSERQCGGWLARSPDGADLKIAVTALTEAEVRAQFTQSVERWLTALRARDRAKP